MLRSQVLRLYKDMLKKIYEIPDKTNRQQLQQFVRQEFEINRHNTDEVNNACVFLVQIKIFLLKRNIPVFKRI